MILLSSENQLAELLPQFAHLSDALRVIDVRRQFTGSILRVMMDAESDEALAFIDKPEIERRASSISAAEKSDFEDSDSKWRLQMAERLASELDAPRFGVEGCWIYGSTKNATAGPHSDIDLILHFTGTADQRACLQFWLEGWSSCLSELNYQRTGLRVPKMVDAQLISDDDLARKIGHASRIEAMTDAARPLAIRR